MIACAHSIPRRCPTRSPPARSPEPALAALPERSADDSCQGQVLHLELIVARPDPALVEPDPVIDAQRSARGVRKHRAAEAKAGGYQS